jgi:hypothetical protein
MQVWLRAELHRLADCGEWAGISLAPQLLRWCINHVTWHAIGSNTWIARGR